MMVLRDTLVSDSKMWSAYQPFPLVSILFLGPSFKAVQHIANKSLKRTVVNKSQNITAVDVNIQYLGFLHYQGCSPSTKILSYVHHDSQLTVVQYIRQRTAIYKSLVQFNPRNL